MAKEFGGERVSVAKISVAKVYRWPKSSVVKISVVKGSVAKIPVANGSVAKVAAPTAHPFGLENRAPTFLNLYSDSAGNIAFSVFSTLALMY